MAIEDSPNGCRAAAAAGMNCVVIPNDITSFLEFDTPHTPYHTAESLSLLEFEHVISRRCFEAVNS
ncbi:hypothetical protein D3C73_929260 [compost metagenome]